MRKRIVSILVIVLISTSINLFNYRVYGAPTGAEMGGNQGGFGGTAGGIVEDIIDSTKSPINNPNYYKPESQDTAKGATRLADIGNTIIGFLQIVGSIISVVILGVIGIKYMVGSAEERAEYKKAMMPYVIGAVMVFAITNLLGIMIEMTKALL